MLTFSYQAIDVNGQEVAGTLEAGGLSAAVDGVRALGLFPCNIKGDAEADSLRRFFGMLAGLRFGKKSRELQITLFTRELSDLVAGGAPLPLSLSILHDRQKPGRLKDAIRALADDVEAGVALSEAFEKQSKIFGELYPRMVETGERGGRLEEALEGLADLRQRRWAHAKAARKSFGRPLLISAVGFVLFLYLYVVALPGLTEMGGIFFYSRWYVRGLVPWPVAVTLGFVEFFRRYFLTAAVWGILFVSAARLLLRVGTVRAIRDAVVLRLPFFRKFARALAAAQVARPLGTLISLGASFPDAFRGALHAVDNQSAAKAVGEMASSLEDGENLEDSLERLGLFPPAAARLLGMIGDGGDPTELLQNAADECDDRLDAAIDMRSGKLTSALVSFFTLLALWLILVIILLNAS